ncbi:hypothetical protein U27_00426 [Candidatus Vecturithrix granuli]|uniref:DinB-like domain-containing protein n=1 Tax=Vecturithrix granuli TaxID=1499967 RepID=A0A081C7H4_VECG1|nr:hypothetical protein U27_00426 [Candidatus Vecturithrix granuli]
MKHEIASNYQKNTGFLQYLLNGLTDNDMLTRTGESNTIGWILGHLILHRGKTLQLLKIPCEIHESENAFERGVEKNVELKIDVAQAIKDLMSRGEQLVKRILELDKADLQRTLDMSLPGGKNDLGSGLSFAAWHETFHIGQIDLIKVAVGMEGIK